MKIGVLTIGQSPRNDIVDEMRPLLGKRVEILQVGILDGLSLAEIGKLGPKTSEYSLVARLNSGESVLLAKRNIVPLLCGKISELNRKGAALIVLLCAGVFEKSFHSVVPVIQPVELLYAVVPLLTVKKRIIDVLPNSSQQETSTKNWLRFVEAVDTVVVTPYSDHAQLVAAAEQARNMEGDIIVLDGIAFTEAAKDLFEKHAGKPVILPKSLTARIICELAGSHSRHIVTGEPVKYPVVGAAYPHVGEK